MNWYSKKQIDKHITKLNNLTNKKKMIKTASVQDGEPTTDLDWKDQSEDSIDFGNFQRYVCDSQTVKVFLTKTNAKYAVSLITNHTYLGTVGWSIYWEFGLEQKKEAGKLFEKVSRISREVVKKFVNEEIPTVLLHPTLRQKFKNIKRGDVVRTNIPGINYSYDVPYETDWRQTIYGNRYPTYKEENFDQYLNSSFYRHNDNFSKGKFAL